MSAASSRLPGFKVVCTVVGALYVLLGASMALRGARDAMGKFEVPEAVLGSPQFADFFHWVFVHMTTLGVLIFLLGRFVESARSQRIVARVLVLLELHYTYLDVRTSDSALGNGLYHGPASLVPPIIDLVVVACFAWLSLRPLPKERAPSAA